MKVYFYLKTQDLILFNGLLAEPSLFDGSDNYIEYYEAHVPGTVMVSTDIDTFIYFQDSALVRQTQLIQN
jgi:hypothetical protein